LCGTHFECNRMCNSAGRGNGTVPILYICLQFLPPVILIPKSELNLQEPCSTYWPICYKFTG